MKPRLFIFLLILSIVTFLITSVLNFQTKERLPVLYNNEDITSKVLRGNKKQLVEAEEAVNRFKNEDLFNGSLESIKDLVGYSSVLYKRVELYKKVVETNEIDHAKANRNLEDVIKRLFYYSTMLYFSIAFFFALFVIHLILTIYKKNLMVRNLNIELENEILKIRLEKSKKND